MPSEYFSYNALQAHIQASWGTSEEWALNDLNYVRRIIMEDNANRKIPFRLIYLFGGAAVTEDGIGVDSDLNLLLRYLSDVKHVSSERTEDGAVRMTYILSFDSSYTMKNIAADIVNIRKYFAERKPETIEENITQPRAAGAGPSAETIKPYSFEFQRETRSDEELKNTVLLAQCRFGPQVRMFFFKRNLTSLCLSEQDEDSRRDYIKSSGLQKMITDCQENKGPGYAELENLVKTTFVDEGNPGELYIYNCAWENMGFNTRNRYFEYFPELLRIVAKPEKDVKKFLLYTRHLGNVWSSESVAVQHVRNPDKDLYITEITPDVDFKSRKPPRRINNNQQKQSQKNNNQQGGARRRKTRTKKQTKRKSKSRRWRKVRTL